MNGKWFLTCVEFDDLENRVSNALIHKKITLEATEEGEAVSEAAVLWRQRTAKGTHKGWDGTQYPHSPRVIYEVSLE